MNTDWLESVPQIVPHPLISHQRMQCCIKILDAVLQYKYAALHKNLCGVI